MTEQEYMNATNHTKIESALSILRNVLVIKGTPVDSLEFVNIKRRLMQINAKYVINLEIDEDDS